MDELTFSQVLDGSLFDSPHHFVLLFQQYDVFLFAKETCADPDWVTNRFVSARGIFGPSVLIQR